MFTKGVCWAIVSFCEHGALGDYLGKRARLNDPVYSNAKRELALGIVKGMAHLEATGFVHRDLAARNVLVAGIRTHCQGRRLRSLPRC